MTSPSRRLHGYVHPDFAEVAVILDKVTPKGGAAVSIYHRGEPVVDLWTGVRNDNGDAWEEDTLSLSFSVTKSITATALHILVDRGLLDYDDRVAKYWPEFAQAGKKDITVRNLLCHQAGLYPVRQYTDSVDQLLDWEYMTDVLAGAEPEHEPGARHGYHGLTFGWLIGELVQRISGKPLGEFVASEISEPLELDGLYIGLPEHLHPRIASTLLPLNPPSIAKLRPTGKRIEAVLRTLRMPFSLEAFARAHLPHGIESFDWDAPQVLSAAIPAANGVFTARSLAKLYAALGNGGEYNGVRLISEATLARATELQSTERDYVLFGTRMNWRLGYHQAFGTRGGIANSFGHLGANGACAWADPTQELAVGFTRNHGMRDKFPYVSTVRISGAAWRCASARAR
ncbi:MAG: serine hydrolase domain-containing protein [Myxococcota bacterium]|nr:serine hydrolase domain-containing protein [Myxococcota bacterium]